MSEIYDDDTEKLISCKIKEIFENERILGLWVT